MKLDKREQSARLRLYSEDIYVWKKFAWQNIKFNRELFYNNITKVQMRSFKLLRRMSACSSAFSLFARRKQIAETKHIQQKERMRLGSLLNRFTSLKSPQFHQERGKYTVLPSVRRVCRCEVATPPSWCVCDESGVHSGNTLLSSQQSSLHPLGTTSAIKQTRISTH